MSIQITDRNDIQGEERIDSRDLIEAADAIRADAIEGEEITPDQAELVAAITEIEDDVSEWRDGAMLIRADTFEEYARELAEDIGAIPDDSSWPLYCIDWERAARELRMDYSSVTFLGHEYLARS